MEKRDQTLPTILVIFGITGDLARKKLLPALFHLHQEKLLPSFFQIVGFSRREFDTKELRNFLTDALKQYAHDPAFPKFLERFSYLSGNFDEVSRFTELEKQLGLQDKNWKVCANKLFYLAVPPQHYEVLFRNLASSGLTVPCGPDEGWTRVIVEKPFGKDLSSAERLDTLLGKLFKEEQIYRIDHYLGKETVQNILAFRFANSFLEPLWHGRAIESLEVRALEKIGIENRGDYYDGIGALRDFGQNHLLQLLTLFTMEKPERFEAESIRRERAKLLNSLHAPKAAEIKTHTLRGQYQGYKKEKGVDAKSTTETYFKIKAFLDHPRWQNVPMYLESGKSLDRAEAEAIITFRHPSPCLCPQGALGIHLKNVLRYHIQPQEGITLSFWVKKPGQGLVLEEKDFSFDYRNAYAQSRFSDAYEKLLLDTISGNQTLFVSTEEVKASWKFIDKIIPVWEKRVPLLRYTPGEEMIRKKLVPIDDEEKKKHQKELAYLGLGKMGKNMVARLLEKGWRVVVYDPDPKAMAAMEKLGATPLASLEDIKTFLKPPRLVWMMVPAGKTIDELLFGKQALLQILQKKDAIIDGGNSFYLDTQKRAQKIKAAGIRFLDVGTSGGPAGARDGACLMIGGEEKLFKEYIHLFEDLAIENGYAHLGKVGVGHFVKMIHNGIEYGMMQALAEGFALMKKSPLKLDLQKIAELYNRGSVIESRLVGWLAEAFRNSGSKLEGISGHVGHTGEGTWSVRTAKKLRVKTPVMEASLDFRLRSAKHPDYNGQILSALRHQFGGHATSFKKTKTLRKKKRNNL